MGKKSKKSQSQELHRQTYKRRMFILQRTCESGEVKIRELLRLCRAEGFTLRDERPITAEGCDIDFLTENFPIERCDDDTLRWTSDPHSIWRGSDIGDRLEKRPPNHQLVELAVGVINNLKPKVKNILVGAGSTMVAVVSSMLRRNLKIDHIYTANLPVFFDFISINPTNTYIWIPSGQLDREAGSIVGTEAVSFLRSSDVDTVITSFMGVSYDEENDRIRFIGNRESEQNEKNMNLQPHLHCKRIVIVLGAEKISRSGPVAVATDKDLDTQNKREYIVITDLPEGCKDNGTKQKVLKRLTSLPDRKVEIITPQGVWGKATLVG